MQKHSSPYTICHTIKFVQAGAPLSMTSRFTGSVQVFGSLKQSTAEADNDGGNLQEALAACGRSHSLQDVCKAIDDVKAAQIQNWSLDLISGLPNVSLQDWESSLRQAVAAQPTHVSVYDLQVKLHQLTVKSGGCLQAISHLLSL